MNPDLALLAEAWIDGDLDAAGAERLAVAIRRDDAEGRAIREHLAFVGLLGQACDPTSADDVARAVDERIQAQASASAFVAAVGRRIDRRPRRRLPSRPRRPASALPLAVAALLLVAIGGIWWGAQAEGAPVHPAIARITSAGSAQIRTETRLRLGEVGSELFAGERISSTTGVALTFVDGSRLMLEADSVGVVADAQAFHLEEGGLAASIAPQDRGRFTVITGNARIAVLGTRFTVAAGTDRTRIELDEGRVEVVRRSDGASLVLAPGQGVEVAHDHPFVAEGVWRDLFADGFAAWDQQHGTWTFAEGVVRGHDDRGGKIRLLGRKPVGDVEVDCEIRITGTTHGEIQVGDYNWFFTLPARDAWVRIRLRQQGQDLACTADGRALVAEPGAGTPMRSGPLSFYGGAAGTVEIRNARIRIP